jgi:tartrate dehydratase beta subunit/fumarate hydratase class I family protein
MDFEEEAQILMEHLWRADGLVYTKRDVIIKKLIEVFEAGKNSIVTQVEAPCVYTTPDTCPY